MKKNFWKIWSGLAEAEKLLQFIYDTLDDMTTKEFSEGGDREIREKIEEFLGIEND